MRYQSAYEHWVRYCAAAGVDATLHQLRHTHATELVNAGVSLATIRKRLGHRNLQTTLRYASSLTLSPIRSSEPGGGERPKACKVRPSHIRCLCGHYYWDPISDRRER